VPARTGTYSALAATVLVELADSTVDDLMRPLVPGLYRTTLDRLTVDGALEQRRGWRETRWHLAGHRRRDRLHTELAVVLLDDLPADARTGPLIMLLAALDQIETVFTDLTAAAGSERTRSHEQAGPQ
jgi:hypothetical protein